MRNDGSLPEEVEELKRNALLALNNGCGRACRDGILLLADCIRRVLADRKAAVEDRERVWLARLCDADQRHLRLAERIASLEAERAAMIERVGEEARRLNGVPMTYEVSQLVWAIVAAAKGEPK